MIGIRLEDLMEPYRAKTSWLTGVLVAGALMASPAPVFADYELGGSNINAGRVSLGGRGMYFNSKGASDETWSGGAQLRLHMTPTFAVEGSADYRQQDFGPSEVHIYPVQASLLAYLMSNKPVSPFLLAGVGWYFTTVETPGVDDDTDHRFGPHVGGGLQFFLHNHWSLDATYRYVWIDDVEARDATLDPVDYEDEGYMITAALNFHF